MRVTSLLSPAVCVMSTGNSPLASDDEDYDPRQPLFLPETFQTQRSSTSYCSTGNTPVPSYCDSEDDYEPKMELDLLPPLKPSCQNSRALCEFIDIMAIPSGGALRSSGPDYTSWHEYLQYDHWKTDHFRAGLIYAAQTIEHMRQQALVASDTKDEAAARSYGGLLVGLPLRRMSWSEVTEDFVSRMTPMFLKSAILQACAVLDGLSKQTGAMSRQRNDTPTQQGNLPHRSRGSMDAESPQKVSSCKHDGTSDIAHEERYSDAVHPPMYAPAWE